MADDHQQIEETTQTDNDNNYITEDEKEPEKPLQPTTMEEKAARMKSFKTRTTSTVTMIAAFLIVIYSGHVPLALMILVIQTLMAKELFHLAADPRAEKNMPLFRLQQWYFFFVASFYFHLRFIRKNLYVELTTTKHYVELFAVCLRRHSIISYSLYTAGILMFVLSLKRGRYRYQFSQFAWTHMIILLIVVPSTFYISNIFEGLIWYLLPSALIVANDIFAYIAGFFFGKTPLIRLSPKKTWEGFIGGFIGTVIFAFVLASIMANFKWMTCPRKDLSIFQPLRCPPNDPIFQYKTYTLPELASGLPHGLQEYGSFLLQRMPPAISDYLHKASITMMPMQIHAMSLAAFASIIAPFGGFFASGFKRAMKTKDFGDTIPGHGGVTDRFDCQTMMAIFSYVYYVNYVAVSGARVGDVMAAVMKLGLVEQLELWAQLGVILAGEGLLPSNMENYLRTLVFNTTLSAAPPMVPRTVR